MPIDFFEVAIHCFSILTWPFSEKIKKNSDNLYDKISSHVYIGSDSDRATPVRKEYLDYVRPQEELSASPFRPVSSKEFKDALHTMSLSADDVQGIRSVSSCYF